jgi:hypothetical protein
MATRPTCHCLSKLCLVGLLELKQNKKNWAYSIGPTKAGGNKSRGSTQIKSRGPDLGAPAAVAVTEEIT